MQDNHEHTNGRPKRADSPGAIFHLSLHFSRFISRAELSEDLKLRRRAEWFDGEANEPMQRVH
ncbi:MAG: hypothetical protein RL591_1665 [Planctomycetota bacterium]|jgi:hypothetical protein